MGSGLLCHPRPLSVGSEPSAPTGAVTQPFWEPAQKPRSVPWAEAAWPGVAFPPGLCLPCARVAPPPRPAAPVSPGECAATGRSDVS